MPAQSVLEELTRDDLTDDHVRRRVADWVQRIETLYEAVESWLPSGWAAKRGALVTMHEKVMESKRVPAQQLPTLELVREGIVRARLRPYGLWIVGTNGRIDLVKGGERYLVLDHSGAFEAPDWQVASANARRNSRPFNSVWLQALLTE